jgi:hypothetical protein
MKAIISTLFHRIASALRERCYLSLEMLALRHQLAVLERSVKRPQFSPLDRCVWIVLSTLWPRWPHALAIMQSDTVSTPRLWTPDRKDRVAMSERSPPAFGLSPMVISLLPSPQMWGRADVRLASSSRGRLGKCAFIQGQMRAQLRERKRGDSRRAVA